jgi:hypothetical protein
MSKTASFTAAVLGITLLAATPAFAQFDLSGRWTPLYHEDELERTDPGPSVGDYLGFPINEAERRRADSWDVSLVSLLEHQCIPHPASYSMRGPTTLNISTRKDPVTGQIIAYVIEGTYGRATRTIWMDGRPHPSEFALHTWAGFSTGVWEGDTLTVETTHLKAGYLRRNGINHTDEVKVTEHFNLHDRYLTLTSIREDPAYLTEPLIQTENWVWNPYQGFGGYKCDAVPELPNRVGYVPHHLPGQNPLISEFSVMYGVPEAAARGGPETMYPEYRKKLKQMVIPHAKVFENAVMKAQK